MNLIDLHMHTYYSDGDLSPKEIIDLIKKSNITTFSITDHDTLTGVKKAIKHIPRNVNFIPGIEFSTYINKDKLHILGYGIDPNNKNLNDAVKRYQKNSKERIKVIYDYLNHKHEINIPKEELDLLLNQSGNIGRPHLAKLLIKYNYVNDIKEAFDKYLSKAEKNTNDLLKRPHVKEIIKLIKEAGGYSIIAHPILLKKNDQEFELFLKEMISYGIDGLEVYHSIQDKDYSNKLMNLVNKYDLLYSGGSDFHGKTVKPHIHIGTGKNKNLNIKKLSIIDKINSVDK